MDLRTANITGGIQMTQINKINNLLLLIGIMGCDVSDLVAVASGNFQRLSAESVEFVKGSMVITLPQA